jgi:carbamoyltransferase
MQTVDSQNNCYLHTLLEKFYKKTGIPLLGNTSLNLAGEPLVETLEDAVNVLKNSDLKYLYLPEDKKLIISQKY